ncbi:hypothetical protein UlMin_036468 [Ulmus minor]
MENFTHAPININICSISYLIRNLTFKNQKIKRCLLMGISWTNRNGAKPLFFSLKGEGLGPGDPYFLEPFWMKQAAQSAILESRWHRMGYSFSDGTYISKQLENHIREVHKIVGNAIVDGRYIIFGSGSTQLLNAAVHALSSDDISDPVTVLASIPYYGFYQRQTTFFQSTEYKFDGDVNLWRNNSNASKNIIEFVTSPNNPDRKLKKAVLKGPNAKAIYDHVYYWPHITPIASPADEDIYYDFLNFQWAIVKDKDVFNRVTTYVGVNTRICGANRGTEWTYIIEAPINNI